MINWGDILRKIANVIGSEIHDVESNELLGKAIFLGLSGRIWIVGYTGKKGLRPVPVVNNKIRYWVQEMRFAAAEEPDYPRKRGGNER